MSMSPERVVLNQKKLEAALGDRWSETELKRAMQLLAADGRFPAGVRGLPRGLVRAIQHERLIEAMTAVVVQSGYGAISVQDVLRRAGISRPTFYEVFEDKDDCFVSALDAAAQLLREALVEAAGTSEQPWQERLRAGIAALLRFVAEEPNAARLVIVESRASSPAGLLRRDELLDEFASCIDSIVRDQLSEPPSAVAGAGIVGGIESVLYTRMQRGEARDLDSVLPSLVYFAVLTYAGHEGAKKAMEGAAFA